MLVFPMAKRQTRQRQAATAWRGDPRDVRPMLAESAPSSAHARLLSRPELVFEPKYDGIRALVALDGPAAPCLYTRLGRDKTAQFPDLVEPLAALGRRLRRPVLLDGEIVATGEEGAALPFQHLQERLHATGGAVRAAVRRVAAALVVFDLLRDGDEDLRPLPFTERRRRLENLLRPDRSDAVRLIESTIGNGAALADRGLKSDWEGIIVKRPDGRYASGSRGPGWQKVKFTCTEEFVVGGWTLPRGSRRHFGALLLGYYAEGEGRPASDALVFAGQVGTGFTDAELDRLAGAPRPAGNRFAAVRGAGAPETVRKASLGRARPRRADDVQPVDAGRCAAAPGLPGIAGRQAGGRRAAPGPASTRRPCVRFGVGTSRDTSDRRRDDGSELRAADGKGGFPGTTDAADTRTVTGAPDASGAGGRRPARTARRSGTQPAARHPRAERRRAGPHRQPPQGLLA